MARAMLPLVLLVLAQLGGAEAQGRGDRNMNSGQGTAKANDKCTFVYKARCPARAADTTPLPLRGSAGRRWWTGVPAAKQSCRPQPRQSALRRASPAGSSRASGAARTPRPARVPSPAGSGC
jgi:hypothetical protein